MGTLSYNLKMLWRLFGKRNPEFHRQVNELAEWRDLDTETRHVEQISKLAHTLMAAKKSVYYRDMLSNFGGKQNAIDFLKTLPYLEKEALRARPELFLTGEKMTVAAHTSGTTGTPLQLRRSLRSIAREEAGFFSWYCQAGWRPGWPMIVLRGDLVVPQERETPPFGVHDFIGRRWVLSSYHMSDVTLPWYIDTIRSSGSIFMSAYPSSAYILAEYIWRKGLRPFGMKAVFLASETVNQEQIDLISEFIGPVHVQYGMAERVCWMTTCQAGCYHEDTSYGFTEYAPLGDDRYEIVATSFINDAQPLIRYQTGDIAIGPFGWKDRCECGAMGPGCRQIIGREDDLFHLPDGRKIGRLDHVFKAVPHIVAAQIIQHDLYHTEIVIVPDVHYEQSYEKIIRAKFTERTSADIALQFTYRSFLPRTARGKFRAVVSKIAKENHG